MKKKICPVCGKPYDKEYPWGYVHYTVASHTVCNKPKGDAAMHSMEQNEYRVEVTITGTARICAESEYQARVEVEGARVMVAGNEMVASSVKVHDLRMVE